MKVILIAYTASGQFAVLDNDQPATETPSDFLSALIEKMTSDLIAKGESLRSLSIHMVNE